MKFLLLFIAAFILDILILYAAVIISGYIYFFLEDLWFDISYKVSEKWKAYKARKVC